MIIKENIFWRSVDRRGPDECWLWLGFINVDGYGIYGKRRAHRVSLELAGRHPGRLHTDHLCRNRACVNPRHLELVTLAENNLRMHARRRADDDATVAKWRRSGLIGQPVEVAR